MALSDLAVRSPKPGPKPRKLYDERGVFLLVNPTGFKWWRLKYRFAEREKLLSLGTYPDVSLRDARNRRDEARQLLVTGRDPGEARKAAKVVAQADLATFETVASEWLENQTN